MTYFLLTFARSIRRTISVVNVYTDYYQISFRNAKEAVKIEEVNIEKTPLYHSDTHELLGYVTKDSSSWQAQTIFGYTIERTHTKEEAEKVLRERGLSYLMGVWQYYDKSDHEWHTCVIQEAYETMVKVNRTNAMGYQDPDDRKMYVVERPSETNLIKVS